MATVQLAGWLAGWAHESEPPMFVVASGIWAIALAVHYRAVRRVL